MASERARVMTEALREAEGIRAAVDRALAEAEAARDSAQALPAVALAEHAEAEAARGIGRWVRDTLVGAR